VTGPEDHSVEHEIWINARPETVWRYWIDPARICDRWGASAELDPRPGGTCLVRLGGDTVMRGEFVELTPTGASCSTDLPAGPQRATRSEATGPATT
jgi:uncharacterized protein YndB with AHSA1/START domain